MNPIWELTFRLVRDGHAPWNAGWLVGLRGAWSLVPYVIVVGACTGYAVARDRRATIAAVAIAIAVLAAYALFPTRGKVADDAYAWIVTTMPS